MPNIAKISRLLVLLGLLGSVTTTAESQDYMKLITDYVQRLNNIYDGTWAYTYTINDLRHDEVRVRRVNPAEPDYLQRDRLVSVNGEPPSPQRLAQHNRMLRRQQRSEGRMHEDSKRPNERPGREKERFLAALIPESIKLEKQEGNLLYLSFRAMEEDRENIFEHLEGLLVLDTDKEYIRTLQLTPTGTFYPFFLTKVEDAFLSVHFVLLDGEPVQQSAIWKLLGQALIFKNLDADMKVVWTDHKKVEPAQQE